MSRWLISAPVWGERHVEVFCATALPALARAIEVLRADGQDDVRLVVHTDQPDRVRATADQTVLELRPLPAGLREFDCMSQAHREVFSMACWGDVVVPLTAGAVISAGGLRYCARVFSNPQLHLVACAVPRVLEEGKIPDTEDAQALMTWAWETGHPMTRDCTWPDGKSLDLSRVYFEADGSVITRQCLPHPLAVRIDRRRLSFVPTVDVNLVQHFDRTEIHLVPDCRELALVKLTPANKGYQLARKTMRERLRAKELRIPDPLQRWFLSRPVVLAGEPRDCGDVGYVSGVMDVSGGWP